MDFGRILQLRAIAHHGLAAGAALLAGVFAVKLGSVSVVLVACVVVLVVACLVSTRAHRRYVRARVGRDSEMAVRQRLEPLKREGCTVLYSVWWRPFGDVDFIVITPSAVTWVGETKTSTCTAEHVARVRRAAAAVRARRPGDDVRPIVCIARARGAEQQRDGVPVVSLDRLRPTVWCARPQAAPNR
jgi:hypothetical protein